MGHHTWPNIIFNFFKLHIFVESQCLWAVLWICVCCSGRWCVTASGRFTSLSSLCWWALSSVTCWWERWQTGTSETHTRLASVMVRWFSDCVSVSGWAVSRCCWCLCCLCWCSVWPWPSPWIWSCSARCASSKASVWRRSDSRFTSSVSLTLFPPLFSALWGCYHLCRLLIWLKRLTECTIIRPASTFHRKMFRYTVWFDLQTFSSSSHRV